MERIDKGFRNTTWKESITNAKITNLPIFPSNHSPILLQSQLPTLKRKRPYKVESWCLKQEEIKLKLHNIWDKEIQGSPACTLQRKLGLFLQESKNYCLNQKNLKNINWKIMEKEAEGLQSIITNTIQGASTMEATREIKDQAIHVCYVISIMI